MNMSASISRPHRMPVTRLALVTPADANTDPGLDALRNEPRLKITSIQIDTLAAGQCAEDFDAIVVHAVALGSDLLDILERHAAGPHEVPVILLSPPLAVEDTRRLIRMGVQDWLPTPSTADELMLTIAKTLRHRPAKDTQVHAVLSAVGGAGATTLALTLAHQAAQKVKERESVALFDLDFSLGNCGTYANLPNNLDLAALVATPNRVDEEFIRAIQKKHEEGFYLYSFKDPALNRGPDGSELILRMLDAVSSEHQQVFLDMPHYASPWQHDVLTAINSCTVVTDCNVAALKHTLDVTDEIRAARGEDFPLRVVVNKQKSQLFGGNLGKRRLRNLLGDAPFSGLPDDRATLQDALDRGLLPAQVNRRSKFVRSARSLLPELEAACAQPQGVEGR